MPLHSKVVVVFGLVVILALATHLIGILPTLAVALLIAGTFVRRVGWRRAIFPFVAHLR